MPDAPITSDFTMHGARVAMASGLSHIEEQVKGIERAVVENPGLAFDLARTVVESACKTILAQRKIVFDTDDDLPKLFKAVTTNLPMLPVAASSEAEARKSLAQTLNGLHTTLQGVCELRNACGFASHGSAGSRPVMESIQATLAAQAADAIVGFLYKLHLEERRSAPQQRPDRSKTVDKVIDTVYEPVLIAGQPYTVSDALFGIDRQAYLDLALSVEESRNVRDELSSKYPNFVQPGIEVVSFVHFNDTVFLKVMRNDGEIFLEDAGFISDGVDDGQFFSHSQTPDQNAELLLTNFDLYSMIMCFDILTEEATSKVAEAYQAGKLESLFPPTNVGGKAMT